MAKGIEPCPWHSNEAIKNLMYAYTNAISNRSCSLLKKEN